MDESRYEQNYNNNDSNTGQPEIVVKVNGMIMYQNSQLYDYGDVAYNDSDSFYLIIENHGQNHLIIDEAFITGVLSRWNMTYVDNITINANGSYTTTVTYKATDYGSFSTTVYIISNDPDNETFRGTVSANTPAPIIRVKQGSTIYTDHGNTYDFGTVNFGSSKAVDFTIENIGGGVLEIDRIDTNITPSWWLINNNDPPVEYDPPITIQPYQSINVTVTFVPDRANYTFDGAFMVYSNDPDTWDYWVRLTGTSP
jgi:hypothetical protein